MSFPESNNNSNSNSTTGSENNGNQMYPFQSYGELGETYSGKPRETESNVLKPHIPDELFEMYGGQQEPRGETKQLLNVYIYDLLQKSSLKKTAKAFAKETKVDEIIKKSNGHSASSLKLQNMGSDKNTGLEQVHSGLSLESLEDTPQGFLLEWWQIFWDLYNAKLCGTGSSTADQYLQMQVQQQKQELIYKSLAVHAARTQNAAEQRGNYKDEPFDSMSFATAVESVGNGISINKILSVTKPMCPPDNLNMALSIPQSQIPINTNTTMNNMNVLSSATNVPSNLPPGWQTYNQFSNDQQFVTPVSNEAAFYYNQSHYEGALLAQNQNVCVPTAVPSATTRFRSSPKSNQQAVKTKSKNAAKPTKKRRATKAVKKPTESSNSNLEKQLLKRDQKTNESMVNDTVSPIGGQISMTALRSAQLRANDFRKNNGQSPMSMASPHFKQEPSNTISQLNKYSRRKSTTAIVETDDLSSSGVARFISSSEPVTPLGVNPSTLAPHTHSRNNHNLSAGHKVVLLSSLATVSEIARSPALTGSPLYSTINQKNSNLTPNTTKRPKKSKKPSSASSSVILTPGLGDTQSQLTIASKTKNFTEAKLNQVLSIKSEANIGFQNTATTSRSTESIQEFSSHRVDTNINDKRSSTPQTVETSFGTIKLNTNNDPIMGDASYRFNNENSLDLLGIGNIDSMLKNDKLSDKSTRMNGRTISMNLEDDTVPSVAENFDLDLLNVDKSEFNFMD